MSLKCFFGHQWNGCKCERCGKIRDFGHKWENYKCVICGESKFSVEKLRKLQKGMTSESVKSIIGNPDFVNSGTNAMQSVLGSGQIIGGAGLKTSMGQKEYWLYETPVGNFQILIEGYSGITAFSGLDYIIEKLEQE